MSVSTEEAPVVTPPVFFCGVRSLAAAQVIIRSGGSNNRSVSSIVPFQYSWHFGLLLQTGQQ